MAISPYLDAKYPNKLLNWYLIRKTKGRKELRPLYALKDKGYLLRLNQLCGTIFNIFWKG